MGVALNRWRRLRIAPALACIIAAGCATSKPPVDSTDSSQTKPTSLKPQLLYILNQPYRRLYVEVDAVKGCEPDDATLAKLKDVLAAHCDKPDGIEIVRRPVIPRSEARGLEAEALACKVMQGPAIDSGTNQAAFLEVLFYDSKLTRKNGNPKSGQPATNLSRRSAGPPRKPATEREPYPALIMMNTSYTSRALDADCITHEGGHALGLVGRTNGVPGHHCPDPQCLMYPEFHVVTHLSRMFSPSRAYTRSQTNFCAQCLAELADYTAQPPPANIYFDGPVFVRSEKAYHVLSLPNRVHVVVGKLTGEDCRSFLAAARAQPWLSNDGFATAIIKDDASQDPAHAQELIDAEASDPLALVRLVAAALCLQRGQLAGAVQISRRSVQEEPEDAMSYNTLAWIEATAPDASLRDGRKAVADATKACELTHWKNARGIETLAAACAENGDFPQAIKYEKMALRLGGPATDQKALQDRLSLYMQSKPFRDQP